MTINSVFRAYRDREAWSNRSGRILASWHIFNPNGPTSLCIGLADTDEPGVKEVFHRWFHFMHDETYVLGYWDLDDDVEHLGVILKRAALEYPSPLVPGMRLFACVPYIVTRSGDPAVDDLVRGCLRDCPAILENDWGRESYLLAKYGAKLFDRAGEEFAAALDQCSQETPEQREYVDACRARFGHIATFQDWNPGGYRSEPFSNPAFQSWYSTVSDSSFTESALVDFAGAWVGAISWTPDLPLLTRLEDLKEFFARFNHELFPEWVDTMSISKRLGISLSDGT